MKMNSKIAPVVLAAVLISGIASIASAQGLDTAVRANVNANVDVSTQGNATSAAAKAAVRGNATSTEAKNNTRATSTSGANAGVKGELTSSMHRSAVAAFVHSLLSIADREGGIGMQVRAVAKMQNDSASTSAEAIAKVENKGKLRALLFGSDYKSLGHLRSEMATTSNNIVKLKTLLSQAVSEEDKVELSAQIKALEDLELKMDAFIKAHESSFSLFGWFTKAFSK